MIKKIFKCVGKGIKKIFNLFFYIFKTLANATWPLFCVKFWLVNFSLLLMSVLVFIRFEQYSEFSKDTNVLVGIFLFAPSVIYFFLLLRAIRVEKRSSPSKNISPSHSVFGEYFGNYIQILLFLSGCFIAVEYLKTSEKGLNIPYLHPGTVGFRSWNAEVEIWNIEIRYLDSDNKWLKIHDSIVGNEKNWKRPVRPYKEEEKPIDFIKCAVLDSIQFKVLLRNCGILFQPDSNIFHEFSNVRLTANIKFVSACDGENDNPGINFITNSNKAFDSSIYYDHLVLINTAKYNDYKYLKNGHWHTTYLPFDESIVPLDYIKENYHSDEYCLEFVFPFTDYAHPFIPALEWIPEVKKKSGKDDFARIANIGKTKSQYYEYKLMAFVMHNKAVFRAVEKDYKGSGLLFEAIIDEKENE